MKNLGKIVVPTLLMILALGITNANAQSNWVYTNSDKPIQSQYVKVKEENGIVYFKMEVKYDTTVSSYCERCIGYVIYISARNKEFVDGNIKPKDEQYYYKLYKTDKTITLPHTFSVSKYNDDGKFIAYWDDATSIPMVKNKATDSVERLAFARFCVDNFKDDGVEEFNRCRRDFEKLTPIDLGK